MCQKVREKFENGTIKWNQESHHQTHTGLCISCLQLVLGRRTLQPTKKLRQIKHEELTRSFWPLLLIAEFFLLVRDVHRSELGQLILFFKHLMWGDFLYLPYLLLVAVQNVMMTSVIILRQFRWIKSQQREGGVTWSCRGENCVWLRVCLFDTWNLL
jgi:hypothetical protein